ncbi:MAG: hypothetical protein BWK78_06100 [Thiotrichaceae bacterium IS1]|nr:MAG: hypothetical protein BWK78_06100 [Thiotrichaceae bacterium IS1]
MGLIGEEKDGEYRAYHFDYRGSIVALTDQSGKVVQRFQYGPYGELVKGEASVTPFLFNGKYGVMTEDNGLSYMRARFYSAAMKRFVNMDVLLGSVGEGQTLNRFAFVTGRPVSLVDPFGLQSAAAVEKSIATLCTAGLIAEPGPVSEIICGCLFVGASIIYLATTTNSTTTSTTKASTKNQALPGEGIQPPGDCEKSYYDYLTNQKKYYCNLLGSCKPLMDRGDCPMILTKLANNMDCLIARKTIMKECFRGVTSHIRNRLRTFNLPSITAWA